MDREVGERVARGAADILRPQRVGVGDADAAARAEDDARLQRREVDAEASRRNRVDDFLRDDLLHGRALNVDERRLAGDGDGFRDRADLHVALIDATNEPVSSMPSRLKVLKPCSENVTVYVPGGKRDDLVETGAIGHGRPRLLDQRRAGDLDGDAR